MCDTTNKRIRQRKSYIRFKHIAEAFSDGEINSALDMIHNALDSSSAYGSQTNADAAAESLVLVKADIAAASPTIERSWARQCSHCGGGMNEGYISGDDYYCESCRVLVYPDDVWNKMHEEDHDANYWTDWEEDFQYAMIGGFLVENPDY